jgi:hypothetical protein
MEDDRPVNEYFYVRHHRSIFWLLLSTSGGGCGYTDRVESKMHELGRFLSI